jgi:hypothetical protein
LSLYDLFSSSIHDLPDEHIMAFAVVMLLRSYRVIKNEQCQMEKSREVAVEVAVMKMAFKLNA